jgi:hypothetical protein
MSCNIIFHNIKCYCITYLNDDVMVCNAMPFNITQCDNLIQLLLTYTLLTRQKFWIISFYGNQILRTHAHTHTHTHTRTHTDSLYMTTVSWKRDSLNLFYSYLTPFSQSLVIKATTLTCHEKNCAACVCGDVIVNDNGACFYPKFYGGAYFGILLSLFWAASVMANVVHCSTAGTCVGRWKYFPLLIVLLFYTLYFHTFIPSIAPPFLSLLHNLLLFITFTAFLSSFLTAFHTSIRFCFSQLSIWDASVVYFVLPSFPPSFLPICLHSPLPHFFISYHALPPSLTLTHTHTLTITHTHTHLSHQVLWLGGGYLRM